VSADSRLSATACSDVGKASVYLIQCCLHESRLTALYILRSGSWLALANEWEWGGGIQLRQADTYLYIVSKKRVIWDMQAATYIQTIVRSTTFTVHQVFAVCRRTTTNPTRLLLHKRTNKKPRQRKSRLYGTGDTGIHRVSKNCNIVFARTSSNLYRFR